eukprot:363798-Chlamydomonas_euryale.AAC.2
MMSRQQKDIGGLLHMSHPQVQTLCRRSFCLGRHPGASWRKTDDPINASVLSVLRIPGVLPSS